MTSDDTAETYQRLLRALGARLDDEGDRFSVVEVADGFVVLLGDAERQRELTVSRDELMQQWRDLISGRSVLGGRYSGNWDLASTGRQDALRALGHELDGAKAGGILLDEDATGLLLTYSYSDPAKGFHWHKRAVHLGTSEFQTLIEDARGRRRRRGLLRR